VRAVGVALGLVGLLAGCSSASDGSAGSLGGSDTEEDTTFPAPELTGTDGTTEPTGTDSTGADTGSGDTDTGGAGTTGDDDKGATPECPLFCGDQGSCQLDEFDAPECVCNDAELVWSGSECLSCTLVSGDAFDVDIDVVDAVFRVTLDEAAFPASPTELGRIVLRSHDTHDEVELGLTTSGELTATVVAGTYDAYYEHVVGGNQVPLNRSAWLGDYVVDDSGPIEIDVGRALVNVRVNINDELATVSPTNYARIVLVDPITGDEVLATTTLAPERAFYVVPGDYEVHYRWVIGSSSVPANRDAVLETVTIEDTADVQPLEVNVYYQAYSGDILVNDAPASASPTDYGTLTLVSDDNPDDEIELGETFQQSYSIKLIPGSYTVYYSHRIGGGTVPANAWGKVGAFAPNEAIRIQSIAATGDITIGTQAPPADGSNDGVLSLRTDGGDYVLLGNTASGQYSRRVMPGTYWPHYSQESAGGQVPINTNARLDAEITINAGASDHAIDVGVGQVSGTITLNKEVPPDSEYDDGRVYLRNRRTGDSVLLGNTRMATFSKPVVPGTYDIVYVVEAAGSGVPVNTEAVIAADQFISDGVNLSVDIPVGRLAGSVLFDGATPNAAGADVVLQDVETRDEVFLGSIDDPQYDETLAGGRYLARYRGGASAYNGPQNTDAAFMCLEIVAGN
jgi:hypothetical protein